MSLSLAPGIAAGVIDAGDIVSVLAVGPSGAGKSLKTNLLASEILGTANPYAVGGTHRHIPEITACAAAATGVTADFAFVPHSGPFARGIHATVQATLTHPADTAAVLAALRSFYAGSPFVRVTDGAPRIKDIVGSNYATLSAAANGRTVAVMCAIDNLTKGAAGGAMQWMNRLLGLPETTGLTHSATGWT